MYCTILNILQHEYELFTTDRYFSKNQKCWLHDEMHPPKIHVWLAEKFYIEGGSTQPEEHNRDAEHSML